MTRKMGLQFPLALPVCHLLAPWGFSDPVALADLGRGSAPALPLPIAIMGEEKNAFFVINKTEEGSLLFLGGVISISKK